MTRLGRWLARWRPTPLLERPVLVEIELAVSPDYTVRLNDLNQASLTREQVEQATRAMLGAVAWWAERHGAPLRPKG